MTSTSSPIRFGAITKNPSPRTIRLRFFLHKCLELIASLVVLATLTFLLLKFLPGTPYDDDAPLNPIVRESLAQQWGLHQSFISQAYHYLQSLACGNLGVSMAHPEQTVVSILERGLGNTLLLNFLCLLVVVVGSLVVSLTAMRFKDRWPEKVLDQVMIALLSLPSLFLGPLLIYFFGFYLNILPVAFLTSPMHYILPVVTLSFRPLASLVRLLKNSLNENWHLDYVRTAHAKGLGVWQILVHHVLRNSLIPYLSYAGPLLVSIFSGSFIVEMLFAVPGLGSSFIDALGDRDYTLIVGLALFYGSFLIIINSLIDILIRYIDPRLREEA